MRKEGSQEISKEDKKEGRKPRKEGSQGRKDRRKPRKEAKGGRREGR